MKIIGIIGTATLSLLLGIAGPAYAQHEGEKQDDPKQKGTQHAQEKPAQQHTQQQPQQSRQQPHAQQQQRPQPAQQQGRQGQARPAQQQARQQPQQNRQQPHAEQQQRQQPNQQQSRQGQARPEQQQAQQRRGNNQPQRTQRSAWDGHRSQHWDSDHRNWQQRGGYRGYRIPDDRFRGYFGSDHGFRIHGLPFLVVGGYPRFQYDGYWLSLVDPWPEYWGNDWYDNDDVYVAYENGYYLYDRRYPGTGIAISISR